MEDKKNCVVLDEELDQVNGGVRLADSVVPLKTDWTTETIDPVLDGKLSGLVQGFVPGGLDTEGNDD